jgi:hypothetical protein
VQYERTLKELLRPMVSGDAFDNICNSGFLADAGYQDRLIRLRADFIEEYGLQSRSDEVFIDYLDGDVPVLQCPALDGVEYPPVYKSIAVKSIKSKPTEAQSANL